jgi:sugar/nucleoside kinase (ribokinase family)
LSTTPVATSETPDALIVGHITRDLLPDGGWRPGGAALYGARAASLRGLRVAVVTSASHDVVAVAQSALPGVALRVVPTTQSTTFENIYTQSGRRQYLRAIATPIRLADIPPNWRYASIALLAPVAKDYYPSLVMRLHALMADRQGYLGLAPQGWLRAWDETGLVRPRDLPPRSLALLRLCAFVFLSREDLTGPQPTPRRQARVDATLRTWTVHATRMIVTGGRAGAELWQSGAITSYPGFPVSELDPTGAGDVFAMTFLCAFAATGSVEQAMVEANQVAALSVEGQGMSGIQPPTVAHTRFSSQ